MRKVEQWLDELYASLPEIECRGLCSDSCGPLGMAPAEWRRLTEAAGHEPWYDHDKDRCSILGDDGLCKCYSARPAICRLFGISERLHCPFGCVPDRWLSREEGDRFLAQVDKISGRKPNMFTIKGPEELVQIMRKLA